MISEIDARLSENMERQERNTRELTEFRMIVEQLQEEVDELERQRVRNNIDGVLFMLFDPGEILFMLQFLWKRVRRCLEGNA